MKSNGEMMNDLGYTTMWLVWASMASKTVHLGDRDNPTKTLCGRKVQGYKGLGSLDCKTCVKKLQWAHYCARQHVHGGACHALCEVHRRHITDPTDQVTYDQATTATNVHESVAHHHDNEISHYQSQPFVTTKRLMLKTLQAAYPQFCPSDIYEARMDTGDVLRDCVGALVGSGQIYGWHCPEDIGCHICDAMRHESRTSKLSDS